MSGILLNPFMVQASGGATVPGAPTLTLVQNWNDYWSSKSGSGGSDYSDWTLSAPASDGGSTILEYQVVDYSQTFLHATLGSFTLVGSSYYHYNIHARARNAVGWGPWSTLQNPLTPGVYTIVPYTVSGDNRIWDLTSAANSYGLSLQYEIYRDSVLFETVDPGPYTLQRHPPNVYVYRAVTEAGTSSFRLLDKHVPPTAPTNVVFRSSFEDTGTASTKYGWTTWDHWLSYLEFTIPAGVTGGNWWASDSLPTLVNGPNTWCETSGTATSPVGTTRRIRWVGNMENDAAGELIAGPWSDPVTIT
jgi:hypothetical protein